MKETTFTQVGGEYNMPKIFFPCVNKIPASTIGINGISKELFPEAFK